MVALPGSSDLNHEANLQHSFTMVSTLLQNGQEDFSSSPTSDLVENQRAEDGSGGENDTGLSSLRHQMNGVIAGDDENHLDQESHANGVLLDNDDDDEQDGTHSNALIHLPQQIGTNLRNENPKRSSISTLNDEDDDDEQEMTTNSPTNSLDYPQQQASSSQTLTATSTGNVPRQSSAKLPEDFCDLCQKHFCNKYYLRVSEQGTSPSLTDVLRRRNTSWTFMGFKPIATSSRTNGSIIVRCRRKPRAQFNRSRQRFNYHRRFPTSPSVVSPRRRALHLNQSLFFSSHFCSAKSGNAVESDLFSAGSIARPWRRIERSAFEQTSLHGELQ